MIDFELDELKREFLSEAGEKVREIETIAGSTDKDALERIAYLAHQLKGSGGSYGFQRISTDAADLEKAIEQQLESGDGSSTDAIRQHVASLRSEIDLRTRELAG